MPLTLGGTAEKRKPRERERAEIRHVLDNRNSGAQQRRVHRTLARRRYRRCCANRSPRAPLPHRAGRVPPRSTDRDTVRSTDPYANVYPNLCARARHAHAPRSRRSATRSIARCSDAGTRTTMPGRSEIDSSESPLEIDAVRISMVGSVEVRPRVRDHVDAPDLKLRPWRVDAPRRLARHVVADDRRRQSLVRDHSALDRVTEIDAAMSAHHSAFRRLLAEQRCRIEAAPRSRQGQPSGLPRALCRTIVRAPSFADPPSECIDARRDLSAPQRRRSPSARLRRISQHRAAASEAAARDRAANALGAHRSRVRTRVGDRRRSRSHQSRRAASRSASASSSKGA